MTRQRWILTICCTLAMSALAFGQAAPEPVITHIPAGSMGYVIVPSVEGMTGKIDKFITDLGLGQALSAPDPDDPEKTVQMSVLDLLRAQGGFGQGFNPKGGFAMVMLNVKDFGIDIMELMGSMAGPMPMEDTADGGQAKEEPKLPAVIFLPGKSVESVLGNYNPQKAGKYMTVMLPVGPMFAGQAGGYVMLSPNDKALDAVLAATKKAPSELPAEQLKAVGASQISVVMNGKVSGPVLMELMQVAEGQMMANANEMAPLMSTYFRIYREVISQVDMITIAGRFVEGGLVFEELVSFQPDTPYAKALATQELMGKADFGALPDMPYVLAASSAASTSKQNQQMAMDMINSLLMSEPLSTMPDELKASIKKSYQDTMDQITAMQFVGGGPKDAGVFGVSMVIRCKDSAKMKDILAEDARIAQELIKHFGKDEPDAKDVTVKYVKGIETIGGISADAIVIHSPKMDEMSENDREEMKGVLGEDTFRFRIASADKNTVVLTFGGTGTFFAEAVKTAKANSGKIGTDAYAAQAMKHLPAKRSGVLLFSASNLFDLIMAGMKKMEPDAEEPPFRITSKIPVALGAGMAGKSAHVVVFVPTELIKEVTGLIMMQMAGPMGGPGAQPPVGDSDF